MKKLVITNKGGDEKSLRLCAFARKNMKFVLSCEHGGNEIPAEFQFLFNGNESMLNSHRGYDLGALDVFRFLKPLADFSEFQTVSHLLIEMNRSLHHRNLFSEFSKTLASREKEYLLKTYYFPYREKIEQKIQEFIQNKEEVFHLSIHSFTPKLNEETRNADIGLLYDPGRISEKAICKTLKTQLKKELPRFKIRLNSPYLGISDGFTTSLRKRFSEKYMGVELEINQKHSAKNQMDILLKTAIFQVIKSYRPK